MYKIKKKKTEQKKSYELKTKYALVTTGYGDEDYPEGIFDTLQEAKDYAKKEFGGMKGLRIDERYFKEIK
jgi:hypothetical protein